MAPIIELANEEAEKETIKEMIKAGVYVIGVTYIGPAASVGHVITGASINTMANTAYQWFDITRVGNENKSLDYCGTVNAAVTGAVSPGRGIKDNIGIAIGSSLMIDDFRLDKEAISGTGAALGGYGRYAPEVVGKAFGDGKVPEFIFEAASALGSEFFTGFANKNIDNNADKEKRL